MKTISKKNIFKLLIILFSVLLLPYINRHNFINIFSQKEVSADTTKILNIKVKLSFDADIDKSGRVDGRDLSLLMFFYNKNENEYKSNKFNINPDINGDKKVNDNDFEILKLHFGLIK